MAAAKQSFNYYVIGHSHTSFRDATFKQVYNFALADFALLTGGGDISPSLYGEEEDPSCYGISKERDYKELCAIVNCLLEKKPIVGICRGAQLLHVYNGGKLIQNLENRDESIHEIYLNDDFRVTAKVNSLHHQGIPLKEAEAMYEYVYTTKDEKHAEIFVEPDKEMIGVQFHPEYGTCPTSGYNLFKEVIQSYIG